MERNVLVTTGYPASGKSFVGEILAQEISGIFIETGDVVRRGASEYFERPISEIESHKLGEYSTMRRQKDGGDYVIQDIISQLDENPEFPSKTAILAGLRDTEAIELIRNEFDNFEIIWVEASFETRLNRLQSRGRQDEDSYTEEELKERDERERNWGTEDMCKASTITVNNDSNFPSEEKAAENILDQLPQRIFTQF